MEYLLSDKEREEYKNILKESKPYTKEEMDELPLDGECDYKRTKATFAKLLLDEDDRRRTEAQKSLAHILRRSN